MGDRISVDEHARFVRTLLSGLGARPTERVVLADALGRITASPVESPIDLPPFRNSQMDGFAVRAADVASAPVSLPIAGEVAATAGSPAALAAGTAVRIMTGAMVPEGADAIVPVEDTETEAETETGPSADGAAAADPAVGERVRICLLYTSPSPRDGLLSRMPSSA